MDITIEQLVEEWSKSQVFIVDSSWSCIPRVSYLCEQASKFEGQKLAEVKELLHDSNQLVVAYAVRTIELSGSVNLVGLTKHLIDDNRKLTVRRGSFIEKVELGSWIRSKKKLWASQLNDES